MAYGQQMNMVWVQPWVHGNSDPTKFSGSPGADPITLWFISPKPGPVSIFYELRPFR